MAASFHDNMLPILLPATAHADAAQEQRPPQFVGRAQKRQAGSAAVAEGDVKLVTASHGFQKACIARFHIFTGNLSVGAGRQPLHGQGMVQPVVDDENRRGLAFGRGTTILKHEPFGAVTGAAQPEAKGIMVARLADSRAPAHLIVADRRPRHRLPARRADTHIANQSGEKADCDRRANANGGHRGCHWLGRPWRMSALEFNRGELALHGGTGIVHGFLWQLSEGAGYCEGKRETDAGAYQASEQ